MTAVIGTMSAKRKRGQPPPTEPDTPAGASLAADGGELPAAENPAPRIEQYAGDGDQRHAIGGREKQGGWEELAEFRELCRHDEGVPPGVSRKAGTPNSVIPWMNERMKLHQHRHHERDRDRAHGLQQAGAERGGRVLELDGHLVERTRTSSVKV